jgi:NTE family protein
VTHYVELRAVLGRIALAVSVTLAATAGVAAQNRPATRQTIGVALGGGSARGFAHVGVIRWFEEHRIPIDLVAGTSMGGLVGGAHATGMPPAELQALLADTDWDEMFGSSSYRFKNIRRKEDARAYPARLEFGIKRGLALPVALNNGQQVDLLLSRIAAAYSGLGSFDDLPTPFRCVAVDLRTAAVVVLDRGSLPQALRATMSLPGIFPPVEIGRQVLVDGGAMNNVPADVVRAMGADIVIAVNVGSLSETRRVDTSILGLVGNTIDAMMLASTRRGMAAADLVISPDLDKFKSLDWRRADALAEQGYRAAEALRDRLLPYALDEESWREHQAARESRRRTNLPVPVSLTVTGATPADERLIRSTIEPRIGQPIDVALLETDLEMLGGLDRYETVGWDLTTVEGGEHALLVRARPKPYAPPFLMLSTNLQNTTSEDFSFQLAARYLTFDVLGAGSELRLDAAVGSNANLGADLYRPLGALPVFLGATAGVVSRRINFVEEDAIVAQYNQRRLFGGVSVGLNLGRDSEARLGVWAQRLDTELAVGDPVLPSLDGLETDARLRWTYDSQNHTVAPSSGVRLVGTLRHVFEAPDLPPSWTSDLTNDGLTQGEIEGSVFWSMRSRRDRVFLAGGLGSSFGNHPLPSDQFPLGLPLRLGAFNVGERRGDNYAAATLGYLRGVARLPDFLGGPIFVGGWLENGSAFERLSEAQVDTHVGLGLIVDTLLGPAIVGASFGFDGQRRYYIGLGRLLP